jgi:hypothetical protein
MCWRSRRYGAKTKTEQPGFEISHLKLLTSAIKLNQTYAKAADPATRKAWKMWAPLTEALSKYRRSVPDPLKKANK